MKNVSEEVIESLENNLKQMKDGLKETIFIKTNDYEYAAFRKMYNEIIEVYCDEVKEKFEPYVFPDLEQFTESEFLKLADKLIFATGALVIIAKTTRTEVV
jgi:hypothetical protein